MAAPIYQILPEEGATEKEASYARRTIISTASFASPAADPVRNSLNAVLKALGQFPFKENYSKVNYILDKSPWTVGWTLIGNTVYLISILPYIAFLIVDIFYLDYDVVGGDKVFEQQLIMSFILMSVVHIGTSYVCWFPSIRKMATCKLRLERFEEERWKHHLFGQIRHSYGKKVKKRFIADGFKKKFCISLMLFLCWVGVSVFNAYSGFPIVKSTFGKGEYEIQEFDEINKYLPPIIFLILSEADLAALVVAVVTVLVSLPQIIGLVVLYVLAQEMIGQTEALGGQVGEYRTLRYRMAGRSAALDFALGSSQSGIRDEDELRELETRAERLSKIAKGFRESGKYIVLIETTLAVCFASVLMFYVIKWVGFADVFDGSSPHKPATVFTLCFTVAKLIVLMNSGEQCRLATQQLHGTVKRIKATSLEDGCRIQGLRDAVESIDIQLSGCGFFGLRRATLTSIAGAVVTYLIVLVQFSTSTYSCFCEQGNGTNPDYAITIFDNHVPHKAYFKVS